MVMKTRVRIQRAFKIPNRTFFLLGPRGVGKSYLLRQQLKRVKTFDLLNSRLQLELARSPDLLEAMIGRIPPKSWIWIDEVQKVPALLDEVHRLIETKGWKFALSGSSARKLRREGANLLGGRALTRHLEPISYFEMAGGFNIDIVLQWGSLPLVLLDHSNAPDILEAYVQTYIREEIREEGLIRKTEPFLRFLDVAGLLNGQQLNTESVARDAQVPRKSVVSYFSILEDTLMGYYLPAYQPQVKVREQSHPKFYWFDPGVARSASGLLYQPVDATWLGFALETFVYHELRAYNSFSGKNLKLSYYRTQGGLEVDFIVELERKTPSRKSKIVCIEVKYARKWKRDMEKSIRELSHSDQIRVDRAICVYLGDTEYTFDNIEVLPLSSFLEKLFTGGIY